jgi:hypothetical protein
MNKPQRSGRTTNLLPCVDWGGHKITRLILGHNPIKGNSHFSDELTADMKAWHEDVEHQIALLERCEACGINTGQLGGDVLHALLNEYTRRGGSFQWIATFYGNIKGQLAFGDTVSPEEELREILSVNPAPIGLQHFGENTDRLFFAGQFDRVRENLKRFRDTGLLAGICTHVPEVVEEAEARGWDVDFYQTSFYTSYGSSRRKGIDRGNEVFDDADRAKMVEVIQQVDKPCLAFKVLGANRNCATDAAVRQALTFAFDNIKPTDIVCVGMWQKYKDQVEENTEIVRKLLRSTMNHEP